jgi:hypothetical protein
MFLWLEENVTSDATSLRIIHVSSRMKRNDIRRSSSLL